MKKNIVLIVILLSATYFISQFYRASLGVVAIDIASDLKLNSEEIGRLGGVFFLSFALTQIPLGILLDTYKPEKIIIFMLLIIFFGTYLFSISNKLELLIFARSLQGIGCGVCLMGPLVILTKTLDVRYFSLFSGIIMGIGGLGALVATEPFYYLASFIGWNKAFYYSSFFILLIVTLLYFFFPKENKSNKNSNANLNIKAFKNILVNKNFLLMLPMSIIGYASFAFILTLWGGKFLSLVHGISKENISFILMLMALFWTMGSFAFGYLEKKIRRKKFILIISALLIAILIGLLCLNEFNHIFHLTIVFCLIGFFGAFTLILISHYRALFDENIIGKVLTTANLFNFSGVFIIQWFTGFIIYNLNEKYNLPIQTSFTVAFFSVIFFLIIAIFFYFKTDEA